MPDFDRTIANGLADDAPSIYDKYCAFLIPNTRITDFKKTLSVWGSGGMEIKFHVTGILGYHNCCTFTAMVLRNVGIDVYCQGLFRVRDDALLRDRINSYVKKMQRKVVQGEDEDSDIKEGWIRTYKQRDNVGGIYDIYYHSFNHRRWGRI